LVGPEQVDGGDLRTEALEEPEQIHIVRHLPEDLVPGAHVGHEMAAVLDQLLKVPAQPVLDLSRIGAGRRGGVGKKVREAPICAITICHLDGSAGGARPFDGPL